jgi:hypothetical protein
LIWRMCSQRRAERLEQQRDDPYYVSSKASAHTAVVDDEIDAIPVIKLDLADLQSPSQRSRQQQTTERRAPTPPPAFVEVDGEIPTGVPLKSTTTTPPLARGGAEGNNGEIAANTDDVALPVPSPSGAADELETSATEAVGIKKVVKKKRKEKDPSRVKKKKAAESTSTLETR